MNKPVVLITILFTCVSLTCAETVTRLLYFSLKHDSGSHEEKVFFEKINILKEIPVVKGFALLKVRTNKMDYHYCLRLVFDDQSGADIYSNHPIHNQYVKDEWKPNVEKGMLVDLLEL
ncbi:MAG: Dabb family protein [Verrucomicrobiota bacterium]